MGSASGPSCASWRDVPRPVPPSRACQATQLERLAHAVSRLTVSHRDPERFFVDRSEVVAGMRALARQWAENR